MLLHALTHIVSQLTYKWLPPQSQLGSSRPLPRQHGREDWLHLTHDLWETAPADSLWLRAAKARGLGPCDIAEAAIQHFQAVEDSQASYLTIEDKDYPPLLRMIGDPPAALTAVGEPALFGKPAVAIVGSRKVTEKAWRESRLLAAGFARAGWVVVSGGAFGCDIAAHQGVLDTRITPCPTVVVQAGGLDTLYPKHHAHLFRAIREAGGILCSERLWHQGARPPDFPVRNRLIAGMVGHVMIMQAAVRSGALVTARMALDAGREVYVLTADDGDIRSAGSAQLVWEGAPCFRDHEQCLRWFHG